MGPFTEIKLRKVLSNLNFFKLVSTKNSLFNINIGVLVFIFNFAELLNGFTFRKYSSIQSCSSSKSLISFFVFNSPNFSMNIFWDFKYISESSEISIFKPFEKTDPVKQNIIKA